jgi:mannose-1-phosphate guanylyltransferase
VSKAFLLSAGLGTRLRPLTSTMPKCLLPIGDKPLLEVWLEHLYKHGIDEVLINTHWHSDKVEEFINSRKKADVRSERRAALDATDAYQEAKPKGETWPEVRLFHEADLLGSAGMLLANKSWVADGQPFFILYGDNLTDVNLTEMYAFHRGHGLAFTLGVFRTETPEACGIAEVSEGQMVTGFVEKPKTPTSDLAAAGIYVADHRMFDFLPAGQESLRPLDLAYHVIPNLVGHMKAYFIEDYLIDIGTPESYERAKSEWGRQRQTE